MATVGGNRLWEDGKEAAAELNRRQPMTEQGEHIFETIKTPRIDPNIEMGYLYSAGFSDGKVNQRDADEKALNLDREKIIPILISFDEEWPLEDGKRCWKQWNEARPSGESAKIELAHIIETYKKEADQIIKTILEG